MDTENSLLSALISPLPQESGCVTNFDCIIGSKKVTISLYLTAGGGIVAPPGSLPALNAAVVASIKLCA